MEKKQIKVKNIEYNFFYDDSLNMWRTIENPNFIQGNSIDMEIDLDNFTNPLDWSRVENFITRLINNNVLYKERINEAKVVLRSFFQVVNKHCEQGFINDIDFELSGINFRGNCKIVNLEERFIYDCFFFPYYKQDPYRDIGSFVWIANFRDTLLTGICCDRI